MPIFLPLHTSFASNRPHHKIPDSEPTTPTPTPKNIPTKHKFNTQQRFQKVIYESTLFQCLIKPQPKQFPTHVLCSLFNQCL